MARVLDSTSLALVTNYIYDHAIPYGVLLADATALRDTTDALTSAERSGDDIAVMLAQVSLGITLVHRGGPERDRGWELLAQVRDMLRPESWTGLAGGSPVPVGTGAPGSRPRFVGEIRRAERGVESLFGGSKCAGRSVKRTLQPRQNHDGRAEPLMSRRRPCPASPGPGLARWVSPGYGRWHVHTVWFGTGEARLPGLVGQRPGV
jgi:hypothetical protein